MVFQGGKWGWRAMATRLLLAPVLTAGLAAPVVAQTRTTTSAPKPTMAVPSRSSVPSLKSGDPKELLQQGRAALEAGRYDRARELAQQAERANSTGRWGLFADTPESLEKDIRRAMSEANKAEASRLAQMARKLYDQPARTANERMTNLDQAFAMASRSVSLTGPTDFIDGLFGERPDKLQTEIDEARSELHKKYPQLQTARHTPTKNEPVQQAKFTLPGSVTSEIPTQMPTAKKPTASSSADFTLATTPGSRPGAKPGSKTEAAQLVAVGRRLLQQNKLVEARAKAEEAKRLHAEFAPSEYSPDSLLKDVLADGQVQVDLLVKSSQMKLADKDYTRAESALSIASQIAAGLNLPSAQVDQQLAQVRAAKSGRPMTAVASTPLPKAYPTTMPSTTVASDSPKPGLPPIPGIPGLPKVPDAPVASANTPSLPKVPELVIPPAKTDVAMKVPEIKPATTTPPPAPGVAPLALVPPGATTPKPAPSAKTGGEILLDQAMSELTRGGDLEMARTFATKAHSAADADAETKTQAQAILRRISEEVKDRERKEATITLNNAIESAAAKQYEQALRVAKLLDTRLLSTEDQEKLAKLEATCKTEMARLTLPALPVIPTPAPTTTASAPPKPLDEKPLIPSTPTESALQPSKPTPSPSGVADQMKALSEIEYQKLRAEGLEAESKAQQAFNRGETDLAISQLADFITKVKGSSLSPSRQSLLVGSSERRLNNFRVMKHQMDFLTQEAQEKRENRDQTVAKNLATQQRQEEIAKKVKEVHELIKSDKFRDAEALALQLKSLEPDNETLAAVYELAKRNRRADDYAKIKDSKEKLVLAGLNSAEEQGPYVDVNDPIKFNIERQLQAMRRGDGSELYSRTRTPMEREIELKLDKPIDIEFRETSLREAITDLRRTAGLNITTDDASLNAEHISLDSVIVNENLTALPLRDVLAILLDKAKLKFVIKNNVISITTEKMAKGQLYTKVFSVMDLVTPIPDFALADHQSVSKALAKATATPAMIPNGAGGQVYSPTGGMQNGQLISQPGMPGAQAQNGLNLPGGPGGTIDNRSNPISGGATMAPNRQNTSAKLMSLITGMVRPYSWQETGGSGKLDYYDIGGALVVNQTADVIQEVSDLLDSLRRLQETSVSVEIRVVSLSEAFFERIGVDFSMNIKTKGTERFERSLTSGEFRPEPFINDINSRGVTVGYNPANGGFTPDLDVPIRGTSFPFGVPPFGGYPGPGHNGGLSVGLAFLNDIQVFMFLEAAQGDRRVNVMQAPKITLFNGQTSTVFVSDVAFFTIGLQVVNVGGQVIYIPQQVPIPIGTSPGQPGSGAGSGVSVTVQAIISADRRFVRMNLSPTLSALTNATVPLFPVTAFITPVFEGGSQGVPIPFTQYFQQPQISQIQVQTTVAVPDGGTVVLGGLKTMSEGRNEFGPPVLSSIPYLNRLFRNQGIGRETRHIMIMVTPRIIIQSEEEFNQVGNAGQLTPPG